MYQTGFVGSHITKDWENFLVVQGIRNGAFIDCPSVLFSMSPEAREDWLNALLTKILLNCRQETCVLSITAKPNVRWPLFRRPWGLSQSQGH